MASINYTCTGCGRSMPRSELVVRRVQFKGMGTAGKVMKTRNTAWLCPDCLDKDPEWHATAYVAAPGTAAKVHPVVQTGAVP